MKTGMNFYLMLLTLFAASQGILSAQQIDYKGFPEWSWHKEGVTEYYLYTPSDVVEGEKWLLWAG